MIALLITSSRLSNRLFVMSNTLKALQGSLKRGVLVSGTAAMPPASTTPTDGGGTPPPTTTRAPTITVGTPLPATTRPPGTIDVDQPGPTGGPLFLQRPAVDAVISLAAATCDATCQAYFQVSRGHDYKGKNITPAPTGVLSATDCQGRCYANKACVSFTYSGTSESISRHPPCQTYSPIIDLR